MNDIEGNLRKMKIKHLTKHKDKLFRDTIILIALSFMIGFWADIISKPDAFIPDTVFTGRPQIVTNFYFALMILMATTIVFLIEYIRVSQKLREIKDTT